MSEKKRDLGGEKRKRGSQSGSWLKEASQLYRESNGKITWQQAQNLVLRAGGQPPVKSPRTSSSDSIKSFTPKPPSSGDPISSYTPAGPPSVDPITSFPEAQSRAHYTPSPPLYTPTPPASEGTIPYTVKPPSTQYTPTVPVRAPVPLEAQAPQELYLGEYDADTLAKIGRLPNGKKPPKAWRYGGAHVAKDQQKLRFRYEKIKAHRKGHAAVIKYYRSKAKAIKHSLPTHEKKFAGKKRTAKQWEKYFNRTLGDD
jgi:hypothetical protein